MFEIIFMKVIDMSKTASVAILILLMVRFWLKRFPKYISYGLWAVVLFRLLCPVSFESVISLIPQVKPISYENFSSKNEMEASAVGLGENIVKGIEQVVPVNRNDEPSEHEFIDPQGNLVDDTSGFYVISILLGQYIWLIGIFFMIMYSMYTYFKMKDRLVTAVHFEDNIFLADEIDTPFVMGILRPNIYLPYGLEKEEQHYIIMHEKHHINRRDHIVKILAYASVCLHWFNPLVWYAFVQFNKDMEMSCDEAVIKKLGEEIRPEYASSLLKLATQDRSIQAVPLAFGEGNTKSRIKNMAVIKKQSRIKMGAVLCLSFCLMLALAANPKEVIQKSEAKNESEVVNTDIQFLNRNQYGTFEIKDGILCCSNASNEFGQLGLGYLDDAGVKYNNISIGENLRHFDHNGESMICLTDNGDLYGMGNNNYGQLGQAVEAAFVGEYNASEKTCITSPRLIMKDVKYAVLGKSHLLILKKDNSLWGLGRNINNEIGIGKEEGIKYYSEPQWIMDDVYYVATEKYNSAAINKKQQLFVWGDNTHGQVGKDGKTTNAAMPQVVMYSACKVYFYYNENGLVHWKVGEPPNKNDNLGQ